MTEETARQLRERAKDPDVKQAVERFIARLEKGSSSSSDRRH
jgi:hypothetical protein